jgi:hypothetical protein
VRFYWNVGIGHLPVLVRRLTVSLAGDRRPWMLKCATRPEVHARADATVLFLSWDAVGEVAPLIDSVAAELAGEVRPNSPPLTLPIQAGVTAAVDPGSDESFGMHRCRVITEGFLAAPRANGRRRLDSVVAAMTAEGIDSGRPHAMRTDPLLPWER